MFKKAFPKLLIVILLLSLAGCGKDQSVVNNVDQRDANVIIVFLESKGIKAMKVAASSGPAIGGAPTAPMYNIVVPENQVVEAMAYLNQSGLPRRQGTNLLELFAKQGLMSTDKEETIRYQAGLAQQITNIILLMDGVIDASVQLSFPPEEVIPGEERKEKITAAVFVKHQGVFDDPNMHLENKIRRLVSGSVTGLDLNDVTVVTDRSRYTDISATPQSEMIGAAPKEYVSIWSIVMSETSAARFRTIFFTLTILLILATVAAAWLIWKFYPILKKKGGLKELKNPVPVMKAEDTTPTAEE